MSPRAAWVLAAMLGVVAPVAVAPASASPTGGGGAGEQGGRLTTDGGELYGRDCASCHGPDGLGSWRGPSLAGTGAAGNYYVLATGRMPIEHPDQPVRRGEAHYTAEQIDALVGHVGTLVDGPAVPPVDLDDVDLALGGSLYRLHCGVCHSSTGIGGALALDAFAPPVLASEPAEVAAVMAAGAGAMPAFYPDAFTDAELSSIVAFVQHLRQPEDRGVPFGRAGRVDEALATWAVAVVALLLLAGWIARAPAS